MLLLGYILAGAAVYSRIEGWDYLDAVYFADVTIFTIGFGDITPKTHLGRSLFFPFAVGGILFVGLIIADIRSFVLESGSRKIATRIVEKARHKALNNGDPKNGIIRLRGIQTRQIGGDTEHERRAQLTTINRIITLVVSASSFFLLWLIGAVVFWQAEMTPGGQNWTYIETLYFTYVALLTIGYGDFYPQSNSAKPAFVFWSLIALPSLTVLIGSIGDAVSDFVNATIKWTSKQQKDLTTSFKLLVAKKAPNSDGKMDFELEKQEHNLEHTATLEAGRAMDGHFLPHTDSKKVQEFKDQLDADEAGYAYRPYMVIKEIKSIVQHIEDDPTRQYTYAKWTRFLRMLYEDEAASTGHRVPGHPEHQQLEAVALPLTNKKTQAWSWMGQESPLMGTNDEPKWLLTKLIQMLEMELKERGDRHILAQVEKAKTAPGRGFV